MSWSLSTESHTAEDIRGAVDHTQPPAHLSEAQLAQVRAAKEAAHTLLNNGAIGPVNNLEAKGRFKVHLSGHAAEDHGAGEYVAVRVEKVAAPA